MSNIINRFYDYMESINHHSVCSVINWIFDIYPVKFQSEFEGMKGILENHSFIVNVTRNDETGEWSTKRYRMKVIFEEQE